MDEKLSAINATIGVFLGLVIAILILWLGDNVVMNVPDMFQVIIVILLIFGIILLIGGMYLCTKKHIIIGIALLVAGIIILYWVLRWYIPIYMYGEWGSWSWYFEFPFVEFQRQIPILAQTLVPQVLALV
jgi:hypothetical protein